MARSIVCIGVLQAQRVCSIKLSSPSSKGDRSSSSPHPNADPPMPQSTATHLLIWGLQLAL